MSSHRQWYYALGNLRFGPVPAQVIRRLLMLGRMRPDDAVWHADMEDWKQARLVEEFASVVPLPPDDPGRTDGAAYVRQIPVLAIVNVVTGILAAPYCVFACVNFFLSAASALEDDGQPLYVLGFGYLAVISGVQAYLCLVGGIRGRRFRARGALLAAAWVSLASTLYCGPWGLALAIWGLVVLRHPNMPAAFRLGELGIPNDEIIRQWG